MTTKADLEALGFAALVVAAGRYWRSSDGALVILDGDVASIWDGHDFIPFDTAGQLSLELDP